jgi:Na+/glutamate symporter
MMNWAALSVAAGMSSCSLMATPTPMARMVVPQPSARVADRQAVASTPAAYALTRSAPRLA